MQQDQNAQQGNLSFTDTWAQLIQQFEQWINSFIGLLPNMAVAVLLVILSIVAVRWMRKTTDRVLDQAVQNPSVKRLIGSLLSAVVIGLGVFASLSVLNLEKTVTSLLAGAGIIGLAIGFAFQELATNVVAGVVLMIRKPFKSGDIISHGGVRGRVQHINLRTTTVRTFTGQDVLIPNKLVFQQTIANFSSTGDRRVDLDVGISYSEDLDRVKHIVVQEIEDLYARNANKPVKFYYTEFGDSAIQFVVQFWIKDTKESTYLAARSEGIIAIKKAFSEAGISIPFPIRTLDINWPATGNSA